MPDSYHLTESGTKWPNCLMCGSEETTILPQTGEWTCEDCGHQWHSDETVVEAGDAATTGDKIEAMLHTLADNGQKEDTS
jgi:ribosomal protein L37AE/L43A